MAAPQKLSDQLSKWSQKGSTSTIASLEEIFGEKTFAVAILLLMSLPALPIPTGGISHVFEVISMLLALELIAGLKILWLPKRWKQVGFSTSLKHRAMPFIIRRVVFLEKHSRPRLTRLQLASVYSRLMGATLLLLSLLAFLAPPFSGLDTLFAMGAVVVSLSMLLGDMFLYAIGILLGVLGIVVEVLFGKALVHFFNTIFH